MFSKQKIFMSLKSNSFSDHIKDSNDNNDDEKNDENNNKIDFKKITIAK